jgi:large subunit ribosomal protein L29
MKAADLREKSVEDLVELEKSLARDFFKTRLKNFTNQLDDTSAIRKAKQDRARVLTVLKQRRTSEAKAAPAAVQAVEPAKAPAEAKASKKAKSKKGEAK